MIRTFSLTLVIALLAMPALSFAQTSAGVQAATTVTTPAANVSASASVDAKLTASKAKAVKEIDRRISMLAELNTRVQSMQKVTDVFKQNLATAIQTQTAAFTTLKSKIDAGTEVDVVKADIKAVTEAYPVFGLFVQQARIAAMADREVVVATMLAAVGAKLQTRINAAQTAGADVTALTTALTEVGTKIANANTQAQAAVSASAVLTAGGDKSKMDANLAALKSARANLDAAHKDLLAAQKSMQTIIVGLKKISTSANATTTTSVTP